MQYECHKFSLPKTTKIVPKKCNKLCIINQLKIIFHMTFQVFIIKFNRFKREHL